MQIVCAIGCLFLLLGLTIAIILARTSYRLLKAKPPRQFYETVKKRPLFVPLKNLPPEVVKVFLLSEDPSFYQHHGIHFAKSAERLTVNQAIILATIMPSPFWR